MTLVVAVVMGRYGSGGGNGVVSSGGGGGCGDDGGGDSIGLDSCCGAGHSSVPVVVAAVAAEISLLSL